MSVEKATALHMNTTRLKPCDLYYRGGLSITNNLAFILPMVASSRLGIE